MLNLKTRDDLQRLVDDQIFESLILDYKSAASLSRDSKPRDELCKDVSAFANSAGGQIVYGVVEDKQKPTEVEETGVDPKITKEWIEQVIDTNVSPRIEGLIIDPIALKSGFGYVITVPPATSRAPHQAPDKKYYKRQNFQSAPMEDYEIRDVLRRATTPDLYVKLSFPDGPTARFDFVPQRELSERVFLFLTIGNRSPQPAFHTVIRIGIARVGIRLTRKGSPWSSIGVLTSECGEQDWLVQNISSPPAIPIFKELEQPLDPAGIPLGFLERTLGAEHRWPITIEVHTPGFALNETWFIQQKGTNLRLLEPGHPLTR